MTTIILPKDNERDIEDIPESVREELTFKFVSDAEEVLRNCIRGGSKMKVHNVEMINECCKTRTISRRMVYPEFALAGRSNVGKSSFINKMIGRKSIARISSKPGKTQTLNFYKIEEQLFFVDVPGYGYAKVSKSSREAWGKMIEQYLTTRTY